MTDAKDLCAKIRSIYPEIGECGADVDVRYDNDKNVWAVDLTRGDRHLTTYLEDEETNACIEGERCVRLGDQVSQLIDNIKKV